MEQDTDSLALNREGQTLNWTGRVSLTWRILAINIIAVLLLAGSLFYIDSFRERLIEERIVQARSGVDILAAALRHVPPDKKLVLLKDVAGTSDVRFRLFGNDTQLKYDSWNASKKSFDLNDLDVEPWQRRAARWLDDVIDMLVDAQVFNSYTGRETPTKAGEVLALASDRTHVITVARNIVSIAPELLVMDWNARDIRRLVRAERSRLGMIIAVAILLSILLSLFLARTIALPLRKLARAAVRVRLGRAREVVVPRLPSRSDEIGQLARAFSDMNKALQARIDATEHFAADVAHEIKNPLASLASAAQSLSSVKKPEQREQLTAIILDDVRRLDRLISDISDLSRIDSQLARTTFERVDIGSLIESLIDFRVARDPAMKARFAFARPKTGSATMRGDAARLGRVIDNLIDNALSFSPDGSLVSISAAHANNRIKISVEDDGPGIPETARPYIFERFHSDRPEGESFGKHSGLGLSIAKAIIEAHDGTICAEHRAKGRKGARFVVSLPASTA
jgi:two-component system, OmpR family, sensor histidine kinase ChvG